MASILSRPQWVKDHIRYIHVLNHILDLALLMYMILTLQQQYILSVLHSQYYVCWCTVHQTTGIDPQSLNIPSLASEELKSFIMEDNDLFTIQNQYHGCWCPGDTRSQGISSHGIDLVFPEYSGFNKRRVLNCFKKHICNFNLNHFEITKWYSWSKYVMHEDRNLFDKYWQYQISCRLLTWWSKETGDQQTWHRPHSPQVFSAQKK